MSMIWDPMSAFDPVGTGSKQHFQRVKDELDRARERFISAQTALIQAERRYNDASREFGRQYFDERKI